MLSGRLLQMRLLEQSGWEKKYTTYLRADIDYGLLSTNYIHNYWCGWIYKGELIADVEKEKGKKYCSRSELNTEKHLKGEFMEKHQELFLWTVAIGLKAIEPERIIGKQIEAARVALTRYMKRTGKVWTRIFPNIPVSKKPTEVRMGKGKGSPEYYACRVKPEE